MQLPATGDVFEEKYQIHQVIGRGGFATVYRATDLEVGRDVALKILSPRDDGYPEAVVARFMREARLLAGLQDPHTITMFDFGRTDDGLLFMVFEYVSGVDLAELLKRREKLPYREVRHILKQVLYALREAHDAGVYHRDIKPANLLIYEYMGDPNCVKLLDFGVAKPGESHPLGPANLTRKGAMVGTPRYMAPEQIYGREITPAADIYSLGLVAFEMLTGRPAMDAKTNKERVRQQLADTPTLVPDDVAPSAMRRVINRMIEKDPLARYNSATQVLGALRGEPVDPPRASRRTPVDTPSSRSDTIDESALPPESRPPAVYRIVMIGLVVVCVGLASFMTVRALTSSTPQQTVELGAPVDPDAPVTRTPETAGVRTTSANQNAETSPDTAGITAVGADTGPSSSGCAQDVRSGLHPFETLIGLRPRRWMVYVPKGYDPKKQHAVMLMFHGIFSTPRDFLGTTKMAALADTKGIVLVALEAADASAEWKEYENYELVTRALEETRSQFCVDDSKLFAMGHGRGGWFARDLGCYMPLSAIAITGSGQHLGESVCRPMPAVPTMRLFGNSDPYVPVGGGRGCMGGEYLSAEEIDRQWIERYGCAEAPKNWLTHKAGVCRTWNCEMERAVAVSCELAGGHDWPGTPPRPGLANCQGAPANFPYRDTIWRFFEKEGRSLR